MRVLEECIVYPDMNLSDTQIGVGCRNRPGFDGGSDDTEGSLPPSNPGRFTLSRP